MQCGVPIPTTSKTLKSTINPKKYDGILDTTTSSNLRSLNDLSKNSLVSKITALY